MSKIFGAFSLKEHEISDDGFYSTLQKLENSKEKKCSFVLDKSIGLIQIDYTNSSEKTKHQNSYIRLKNNLSIVADAALTNRTELLKKFGTLPSERKKVTDNDLILKSYQKWGENCPEYLVGDFAFAIWDKQNQRLFCARDHFGASTLFFYKDSEKFIFGTQPFLILGFKGVEKKLNFDKLATYICPEPHIYARQQSWYENIFPVSPGTCLSIDNKGIKSRTYWKPKQKKTLTYKKESEIYEAFRELLFEVIEARLESHPFAASLLSGGLDSSSIVSIAANILEKQNREINVFASVVPKEYKKTFEDELFYIDQFKKYPNVKLNYVSTPNSGPFSNLEDFFENHDNPILTSRHFLYTAFTNEPRLNAANTIFDGGFGEMGVSSFAYGGLAEMFAKFQWIKLWRELKLNEELYNISLKYNIRANIINPFLPQFLINLRRRKLSNKDLVKAYNPINEELTEKFLEKINLKDYLINQNTPNHQKRHVNDLKLLLEIMGESFPLNYGNDAVEYRFPLLDKRLIDFTLAVPLSLKFKDGYSRFLIRASLDKILPPKIQWRTTKAPFSPDYMRRYNLQIGQVRELLADIKPNDPIREIIDIKKITEWAALKIPDTERHSPLEDIARTYFPAAIYLIYFLRKFSEFRL